MASGCLRSPNDDFGLRDSGSPSKRRERCMNASCRYGSGMLVSNGNEQSQIKRLWPFASSFWSCCSRRIYDFLLAAPAVGVSFELMKDRLFPVPSYIIPILGVGTCYLLPMICSSVPCSARKSYVLRPKYRRLFPARPQRSGVCCAVGFRPCCRRSGSKWAESPLTGLPESAAAQ
jgi:hypothetical protein